MKVILATYLLLFSSPLLAHDEEIPINNTSELKLWCKNKSSEYFLAQDITPYNWTASWWSEGNFLHVKGSWKIGTKEHIIKCSIRKGVAEKYAIWKFIEK